MVSELTKSDISSHCSDAACVKEVTEIVQKLNGVFKSKFKNFMNFDADGTLKSLKFTGGFVEFPDARNGKSSNDKLLLNPSGDGDEKKDLQIAARNHILAASPSQQLFMLQELQNQMPATSSFVLVDPYRRPYAGSGNPQYGPHDLYYFISDHFAREMNKAKNQGQDPFYQPILYPSDASIDTVLQQLIIESPYNKFLRLYDQYKKAKSAPEIHADRLREIYKTLTDPNHVSNPWYMTKFIEDQQRPMETYRNKEFVATLSKFADAHASIAKPKITKVTVQQSPEQERVL